MNINISNSDSKITPVLSIQGVSKQYLDGNRELNILNEINLSLAAGERCALMGPSGSGKSTLLSIAAGLLLPTTGSVFLAGSELSSMSQDALAILRRSEVGFVFQSFNLVPTLTAIENIMLPLELDYSRNSKSIVAQSREAIDAVGLSSRMQHYPWQLSGGEQQRIAIARAFVHHPRIIFADEPTGSLDIATGNQISKLLFDLNERYQTALLLVTHNPELAKATGRVVELHAGRIVV